MAPGTLIDDRYEILSVLGEGGLGKVLLARHTRLSKLVALKILKPHVAKMPGVVERFQREAQACARIACDHVVRVVDTGHLAEGEPYLVMDYLDGETLESRLRTRGRLAPRELAPIASQVLEALASVHAVGVVHRDVKPANVFLARTSAGHLSVKLVDFGVAKTIDPGGKTTITRPGLVLGTPAYMSPEQARGDDLDGRSDLFSLGVLLYEAAASVLPFVGSLPTEIMASILNDEPIPLRSRVPDFDRTLATIVHRALSRDPVARYASANEMLEVVDAWRSISEDRTSARLLVAAETQGTWRGDTGEPSGIRSRDEALGADTSPGMTRAK